MNVSEPGTIICGGGAPGEAPRISVVCASNDAEVLERMLMSSLRRQTLRWELRVVDAKREGLVSCAQSLNLGASQTTAPWLLFVHQDVAFDDPELLARTIERSSAIDSLGAAGPVGAAEKPLVGRQRVVGEVEMGPSRNLAGGVPVDRPTAVQTLDELMIFTPRSAFDRVRFDELACPDWHLYGVDYCLSLARLGLQTYILPIRVHHWSGGTLNAGYYVTLARVVAKHRARVRTISTTSEAWPTWVPTFLLKPIHLAKVLLRLARQA